MAESPTTGELYEAKAILEADVVAAEDAFMQDPSTTLFVFGEGYQIDLAASVGASSFATRVVNDGHATETHKRCLAHRDPAGTAREGMRSPTYATYCTIRRSCSEMRWWHSR
jgi:hypothetical protein